MTEKHFMMFSSLEELQEKVKEMPRPAIAAVSTPKERFAHFRHATRPDRDRTYTVGNGPFRVGMSVLGGKALLQ